MKHLFSTTLIAFVLIFAFGCKKEKLDDNNQTTTETTVAEDKAHITASLNDLSACVGNITKSSGLNTITDFLGLDSTGTSLNSDWTTLLLDSLGSILEPSLETNNNNNPDRFVLANFVGTYSWDANNQKWMKSNSPSDKAILQFPATPESTTNNAVLTISDYTDTKLVIDGTDQYFPASFSANITVDGDEVFSVNGSATYDNIIPVNISFVVKLKPFTYSVKGNRLSPTKFNASMSVSDGGGCVTSASIDFEFTHSDYATLNLDQDLKAVTATITSNQLQIVSVIDALTLNTLSEPNEEMVNNYIKTNVSYNNSKVGELKFYNDGTNTRVKIFYKDGSSEDTKVYYEPFLQSLEQIFKPIAGDVNLDL